MSYVYIHVAVLTFLYMLIFLFSCSIACLHCQLYIKKQRLVALPFQSGIQPSLRSVVAASQHHGLWGLVFAHGIPVEFMSLIQRQMERFVTFSTVSRHRTMQTDCMLWTRLLADGSPKGCSQILINPGLFCICFGGLVTNSDKHMYCMSQASSFGSLYIQNQLAIMRWSNYFHWSFPFPMSNTDTFKHQLSSKFKAISKQWDLRGIRFVRWLRVFCREVPKGSPEDGEVPWQNGFWTSGLPRLGYSH